MLEANRLEICQGPINPTREWAQALLEKTRTCLDFQPLQEWKDR
jgi:hypothetical protein